MVVTLIYKVVKEKKNTHIQNQYKKIKYSQITQRQDKI